MTQLVGDIWKVGISFVTLIVGCLAFTVMIGVAFRVVGWIASLFDVKKG